jgi:energy-converting hydrogenase Eha subunit G
MPGADLLAFFRSRENIALPVLIGSVCFIAVIVGMATLGGYVSPGGAMFFAALLCALTVAWYALGFLLSRGESGGVSLLLSGVGWMLATFSFLVRAVTPESRAAVFLLVGAMLLILASVSLFLSSLLVGASTPAARQENLGDALRDARDL